MEQKYFTAVKLLVIFLIMAIKMAIMDKKIIYQGGDNNAKAIFHS